MHKTKILTIEDLIKFCEDNNFAQFNSEESGYTLHVQVPCEKFEVEATEDPFTLYANVRLMHTGRNRNRSNLTEKAAKNCLSKIAYKPVLADFTDINGERDFTYHAMEFNEDGTRTYIERQVGCFTSDNPYIKQDPDHEDRKYIYARVAIPREYTDSAEIIERKGGTKVSAELAINEMSYSVEDGLLLEDVEVMGVCLLGTDPDTGDAVMEGMENAFLQIEDFSADNNSIINKSDLINEITTAVLERLSDNTVDFSIDKKNKEVKVALKKKDKNFETEVNATEGVVATETPEVNETFENEEDSGVKTNESVDSDEDVTEKVDADDTSDTEGNKEDFGDDDQEDGSDEETDEETEPTQSVSAIEDEDSTGTTVKVVNIAVGEKTFELSLDDVNYSINCLVNDMYSETDNTYYMTVVYPESKYVVMIDVWSSCNAFKQSYKDRKGVYSLIGERVPVRSIWVTADEEAELDRMRSDYSAIESELNTYKSKELHSQREAILSSDDYSVMKDFVEFNELKSHMDEYSVEDLSKEADLLYAKFMKSKHGTFSSNNNQGNKMVFMNVGEPETEKRQPYGGLFKNFKNK